MKPIVHYLYSNFTLERITAIWIFMPLAASNLILKQIADISQEYLGSFWYITNPNGA